LPLLYEFSCTPLLIALEAERAEMSRYTTGVSAVSNLLPHIQKYFPEALFLVIM